MAVALVGGSALGAVFGELLKVIMEAKNTASKFKSVFNRLESTLTSIDPVIKQIEALNEELDRPNQETQILMEQLKKGEKLVGRCSKVHRFNYLKKWWLGKKLLELDESLCRFVQMEMQVHGIRDNKETLLMVKQMSLSLRKTESGKGCCAVPEPPALVVGLDVTLHQLKKELLLMNEDVSKLLVSAPVGFGKTTLVKKLCRDEEIKGRFKDNLFFVTVTKTPNLKIIVENLFRHKGYEVPVILNDKNAIHQLELLLKRIEVEKSPILLVLDDVWPGSESLLDSFVFQISNYKILVTSRSEFPGFAADPYSLGPLDDADARTLFDHSALPQDMLDEDLINKIVRSCKGSPLALTLVGRSLCRQPIAKWKIREMSNILCDEADLLDRLKSSLDVLDGNVVLKESFIDLASFPEDQRIPADALIDMWVELYKLEEEALRPIVNLHELCSRNLANLVVTREDKSEVDGCYNEHFVKQHDLLRDLAVYLSSLGPVEQRRRLIVDIPGNSFPKWWMEQKQQPVSARLLCIFTDEKFSSSWCSMQAPDVEVLVLNFRSKNYSLPEFLKNMHKLKVLIVTNYGSSLTEISNFELLGSLANLKRLRLERVVLPSLGLTTVPLKNLQKISLVKCNIDEAYRNCTIQISSILPNLVEMNIDYCKYLVELPAALCDLIHLKKLSITNCHELFALPDGIGKLVNIEVLCLQSCTGLLALPDSIGSLHKLSLLDISDCLRIREMPKRIGELCNLRELYMRGCPRLYMPPSIRDLKELKSVVCDEETALLWEPFKPFPVNLRIKVPKQDINLNWLLDF